MPTAPFVDVTISPSDYCGVLSADHVTLGRFSTVQAQNGPVPGIYRIHFTQANYNIPLVIQVASAILFTPFDPHNEFISHAVTAGAPEYLGPPAVSATPIYFQIFSNREPNGIVHSPAGLVVTQGARTPCPLPGPRSRDTPPPANAPPPPIHLP